VRQTRLEPEPEQLAFEDEFARQTGPDLLQEFLWRIQFGGPFLAIDPQSLSEHGRGESIQPLPI